MKRSWLQALASCLLLILELPCSSAVSASLRGGHANASANSSSSDATQQPATAPAKRQRLDFGFASFEANLTADVVGKVRSAAKRANWTSAWQDAIAANITTSLSEGLKAAVAPVKAGIGKTWMALPTDDQKNQYVNQLRSAFMSVFDNSLRSADTHMRLTLDHLQKNRVGTPLPQDQPDALLAHFESLLKDNLLQEHCHEFSDSTKAKPHKFCLQSVVTNLAHRLNDTEGLIGMGMRFEAGALSFAERAASSLAQRTVAINS